MNRINKVVQAGVALLPIVEAVRGVETLAKKIATKADEAVLTIERAKSVIGSCECLTKTPDHTLHSPDCKYRIIKERDDYFDTLVKICEKFGYTAEVASVMEKRTGSTKVSDGLLEHVHGQFRYTLNLIKPALDSCKESNAFIGPEPDQWFDDKLVQNARNQIGAALEKYEAKRSSTVHK